MRLDKNKHIISDKLSLREVLPILNQLAIDAILFVVDKDRRLIGALTDGDIRRGLIKGLDLDNKITFYLQKNPKFLRKGEFDIEYIKHLRNNNFKIIPIVDSENHIVDIINFRLFKSYLPIDAVIMAGGEGKRLRPLTDNIPKPLLKISDEPLIKLNIDRLIKFGLNNITITVNYLADQIIDYFGDGQQLGISINYTNEDVPLGTAGSLSLVKNLEHDIILLMNSDLLTNINFEDFYVDFISSGAQMGVATIPYEVKVPYAVLETNNGQIHSFKEKPTYTYYSNAGIYLLKKELIKLIPNQEFFDTTDLMELLIDRGEIVFSYPIRGYWQDIGTIEDIEKARRDVSHLEL